MTKILVVDDEEMMIKLITKVLSEKYEVLTASSGEEAIKIFEESKPDLILSDLLMPGMSGFEMHERLQQIYSEKIPIMYMTADEGVELEGMGFDRGAMDFIRKPFRSDVLLRRINNILNNIVQIKDLKEEASTDQLTGFLNKAAITNLLTEECKNSSGMLLMIDLDSFKLVNDIYGHEMGDEVLISFARLIRDNTKSTDILGRIGGDEFIAFLVGTPDEKVLASLSTRINKGIMEEAKKLMGEEMNIPLGVSIGGVFVPLDGSDYDVLFSKADKALYHVKQNGKHGYSIYGNKAVEDDMASMSSEDELKYLSMIMEERNTANCAFWLGQDAFSNVYRFILRYIRSYNGVAHKVLFTLEPTNDLDMHDFNSIVQQFGELLNHCLRKSDIMMQVKQSQFFLLLPELSEHSINTVIERILTLWNMNSLSKLVKISWVAEFIDFDSTPPEEKKRYRN